MTTCARLSLQMFAIVTPIWITSAPLNRATRSIEWAV